MSLYNSIKHYSKSDETSFWRTSQIPSYSQLSVNYAGVNDVSLDDQEKIDSSLYSIFNYSSLDSGLLPPGIRLSVPGVLVFERPPSMQLIQYINNTVEEMQSADEDYCSCDDEDCEYYHTDSDQEELDIVRNYYVPVPWQLYIATYSLLPQSKYIITSVRMYFMNSPLHHSEVQLYAPYIPNFFANGVLCSPMFESSWEVDRYPRDLSGVMASAYDWVWNTGFNADLYECIQQTLSQATNEFTIANRDMLMSHRFLPTFYKRLSEIPLEKVVNYTWANPSLQHHFDRDRYFYLTNQDYFNKFLSANDLPLDTPIPSNRHDQNYEPYLEWIGDPSKITKTYADIINHLVKHCSDFVYNISNNSGVIKDYNDLASQIYSLCAF